MAKIEEKEKRAIKWLKGNWDQELGQGPCDLKKKKKK